MDRNTPFLKLIDRIQDLMVIWLEDPKNSGGQCTQVYLTPEDEEDVKGIQEGDVKGLPPVIFHSLQNNPRDVFSYVIGLNTVWDAEETKIT